MFVLTIDQVRSRDGEDLVPELLASLDGVPVLVAFERTVGDEVQGVVADAAAVLTVVRRALASGHWHVGLGIGEGELGEEGPRSGTGPAFLAAREAVESAKRTRTSLAVRAGTSTGAAARAAADAEAALRLVAALTARRTVAQARVVALLDDGMTGKEVAETLGVSAQAVSKQRIAAAYDEERSMMPVLVRLLEQADAPTRLKATA
ncbi:MULTISPECIES: hypothetical protein [unclassified Actinomyces]|uniref:hypothetical protein n=1 Tax=unclassified Actinomyces TaxID=2609248 RepID=UPI002016C795|nr:MULTISPECIES: hypothetical protein [unclassified Actinomyces]MCL3776748.1 hypothetical protein [Actinomyces sp. AC-20-1]MCL3789702.1 hypothetical protein [Actinomyces sp. 187325]MCL3791887.1 hypothetical protein [Actinomyces sp. 186855]MCL3794452.1 hypothetical protein [Actinomyces sp. 217892]